MVTQQQGLKDVQMGSTRSMGVILVVRFALEDTSVHQVQAYRSPVHQDISVLLVQQTALLVLLVMNAPILQ